MIFCAVAAPTPGSASSSAAVALFKSTFFEAASAPGAAKSAMASAASAIPRVLRIVFMWSSHGPALVGRSAGRPYDRRGESKMNVADYGDEEGPFRSRIDPELVRTTRRGPPPL